MPVSLSSFLKNATPAPSVVLLPDTMFFVRAVPVADAATPADLVSQVELALEAIAPFPLAQLYYGFYHPPGAPLALLYAAYRKRFTSEQTAAWAEADLVLPAFVALFGLEKKPGTTLVIPAADGVTAVHWRDGQVPDKILAQSLAPEATQEEYARVREELLRAAGGSLKVVDLPAAPVAAPSDRDDELVFHSGDHVSTLPAALGDQLDVRDKEELALRRRHRARDLMLWRLFLGCAAALALCVLGEVTLLGGKLWQKSRLAVGVAQSPAVEKIKSAQSLADRIGELSTKRLLPFEMIALISGPKPASVQFLRTTTTGLYTLEIEAQTSTPVDVGGYQTALSGLPACAQVELRDQRTRDGVSTFTFVVTFKPEALQPATAS
ncbi:MAG TPA: hypothetical protein VK717_11390 [Opitutaceae bacterium]|jgi:hypothetical protein|nr:hypothetical protein [Opitutaceae bacterium]